jgi:hypothetical protein
MGGSGVESGKCGGAGYLGTSLDLGPYCDVYAYQVYIREGLLKVGRLKKKY